jgi:hypothetical protein
MYRNETLKIDPMTAEVFWCHIIPGDPYDLFPVPGAGFGKGQAAVELAPLETGCELRYAVKSTIGGQACPDRPASDRCRRQIAG